MSTTDIENVSGAKQVKVNDIVIHIATPNGSGSQSANSILLRSIMEMGIPVSGKNLFPSNIQGLPTWFTIRANKNGYVARRDHVDLLIASNRESAHDDLKKLSPGALVIYDEPLRLDAIRDDLHYFPVPFGKLVKPIVPKPKMAKLVRNIIYVGVAAKLLGIDMEYVKAAIDKQFKSKATAAALNVKAAQVGYDYTAEKKYEQAMYRMEKMDKTSGKIVIDGNAACALGCMFAGVSVVTWYPITPSTSVIEELMRYMSKYRIDPETGKATFAILQTEDELAAIGMVLGASWAGARAMTSTSGPGISLMAEFSGLSYFAEVPGVIVNVQRVGPSTGLPTRTMQGDVLSTAFLSHGDTKHMMLFPGSPKEAFEMSGAAFDLAEQFQTLVFVMSDLDLGMNKWLADPFDYPEKPFNRGKVATARDLDNMPDFGRYKDVDGDGIPYRTLPGTEHFKAPYFTRGTGHDPYARYTEDSATFVKLVDRLNKKMETARGHVPKPVIEQVEGARTGLIAYGTSDYAVEEGRAILKETQNLEMSYMRIRAFPFTTEVFDFIKAHDQIFVLDQNRDGQMYLLLKMELDGNEGQKLHSITCYDGMPLSTDAFIANFNKAEKGVQNG